MARGDGVRAKDNRCKLWIEWSWADHNFGYELRIGREGGWAKNNYRMWIMNGG